MMKTYGEYRKEAEQREVIMSKVPEVEETVEQMLKDIIDYWLDFINDELGTIEDINEVRCNMYHLREVGLLKYFTIENTGIFAYLISPNLKGGKVLSEVMFYILPENRGSLKLVKQYLNKAEQIAKDQGCRSVNIGSNIEFKDSSFIKLLKRMGYEDDTVAKYI